MWVEQNNSAVWSVNERMAVVFDQNPEKVEGTYLTTEFHNDGYLVHFLTTDGRELSASNHRKFFKWVEEKVPTGESMRVAEARLRLRKPDEMAAEVEAAEAHLIRRIERLEDQLNSTVIVGRHAFKLTPGDHLRVWWEDGALWSELVQGDER
jgi:hypothetical protein